MFTATPFGALDLSPSLLLISGPPQGKDESENEWSRIIARLHYGCNT
jgi:hypothetical protein